MKLGIVTTSRADYGIYTSLLRRLSDAPDFDFSLLVGGTHLEERHGETLSEIQRDGFPYVEVGRSIGGSSVADVAHAMGKTAAVYADAIANRSFDAIVVLGDRFEMFAAAAAIVPFGRPLIHLHGGECTEGAFDNKFRHALTKLADLHFVSSTLHATRVRQMGAPPHLVENVGALSLDSLRDTELVAQEVLWRELGLSGSELTTVVTYHPVTYELDSSAQFARELVSALSRIEGNIVVSEPNADPDNDLFRDELNRLVESAPARIRLVKNLGIRKYFSLMRYADVMVGNSSSGIIEAASFGLPVVNIGNRQKGRDRSENVRDSAEDSGSILEAHSQALSLRGTHFVNIYDQGGASARIIEKLRQWSPAVNNAFVDYNPESCVPGTHKSSDYR